GGVGGEPVGVADDVLTHVAYLVARQLNTPLLGDQPAPGCEHRADGAAGLNRGRVRDAAAVGRARDAADGRAGAGERQGELVVELGGLARVAAEPVCVWPAEPQPVGGGPGL